MANINKILLGAAMGTVLGSLAIALFPSRRQLKRAIGAPTNFFTEKTRDAAEYLLEEAATRIPMLRRQNPHKFFWSGSVFGLLAGASTALLLAPKTGKSLRQQIVKAYNNVNDKTHEVIHLMQANTHEAHHDKPLNGQKKTKTARPRVQKAEQN